MNILLRMLANPPFASYVIARQPSLAELAGDLRAQPELAHDFGADQYLVGSVLPAELEVDPLAQRAQFVLLPVDAWQQLVAGFPRVEPPTNYTGTWVAGRQAADRMIVLPDDRSEEPYLMLYAPEYQESRVCLEIARAAAPYSTLEQLDEPCRDCYKLEQGWHVEHCENRNCSEDCSPKSWIEDDNEVFKCICPS
jgi:hypothetical protein